MNDLSFILPLTMTVLGMTLLWVGVTFSRACLFWGSGYLMAALAFAMPLQGLILPPWGPLLAEALFVSAFFLYGQALITQFPGRSALVPRLALSIAAYCALAFTILVLQDEELELRFGDLSSSAAILLPVALVIRRRKTAYGHALIVCASLVGLETATRALVSILTSHLDPSMPMSSPYLLVMQGSAALFGHLMAIAALATAVHDKMNSYRHAAERDALTGLLNRRGFERAVAGEPGRPAPGAVILCDIDHFKRINDTLGHAAGDRVIIGFAAVLQAFLPRHAAVARHGGEEFIAFLPDHTAEQARILSHLLRQRLSATDALVLGSGWVATASFGVSGSLPEDAALADVIRRADRALYRAKNQGRDRVVADMARGAA